MTTTAFASPAAQVASNNIIKSEYVKPGAEQQGSQVLPKPNMHADNPIDVYSLDLFRTTNDVKMYGKTAVGYFKQHDTEDKLIKAEVPVFLVHKIGNVLNAANVEEKAFLAMKLITMARYLTVSRIMALQANLRIIISYNEDYRGLNSIFNLIRRSLGHS